MVFDKLGKFVGKAAKGAAGGGLEVVKWPDHLSTEDYIAWRYPKTDIKMGSVVVVDEAQKALFFRDGKLMGVLDSGRHVLDTQNVPFLHGLVSELYGETIFKASIVFVNLKQYRGELADRVFVDYVGGHVVYKFTYYYTVDENKLELFYVRLMGAESELSVDDVNEKIRAFMKRSVVEMLAEYATQQAQQGRIVQNVMDFVAMLSEFGEAAKAGIARRINEQFGLNIVDLVVENIDIAPEDKQILQMSGPRAFAAMYQRDWVGREKIAESLSNSQTSGVVAPFLMFPWMMYPPQPPQAPPQPPMTPPAPPQPPGQPPRSGPPGPGQQRPPQPPGYPPGQPYPYPYPYPAPYYPQSYPYQQPYPPQPGQPPQQRPPQQAQPYQTQPYPVAATPYQPQPPQAPQAQQAAPRAKCPYCGRDIPYLAPVCPYCAMPIKWCPDGRPVRQDQEC